MATNVATAKASGNYINNFSSFTEISKLSITRQVKHRSLIEIWKATAYCSFIPYSDEKEYSLWALVFLLELSNLG
jgi:hypothetical protein